MLAQQRATFPAGKQGSKSASATAATPTSTHIKLPPALTENALSSLCRLPISTDSTINWQRYDCGSSSDNRRETQAAHEALLQLSHAESKAFQWGTASSSLPLLQSTLWAVEREAPDAKGASHPSAPITSIWLFNLQSRDIIAESSSAALSDERRHATSCKEKVELRLSHFKARREQGYCRLQDFYSPLATASYDQTHLLSPLPSNVRLLTQFLRALEEHFLASWVRSSSEQPNSCLQDVQTGAQHTDLEHDGSSYKQDSKRLLDREEGEKDEEEEGAIGDGTAASSRPKAKLEYWPRNQRSSRGAIRFGDGVILQPLKYPGAVFDKSLFRDRKIVRFALRCFVDDQGHIYLETRPMKSDAMEHIEDIDVGNRIARLAPSGMRATLIDRIKDFSWTNRGDDRESEKQALECKQTLLAMLEVRGIDIGSLGDDWTVCETEVRGRFLWPTKLCFAMPKKQDDDVRTDDRQALRIFLKPLLDVAERAKGLLRESTGVSDVAGDEDAMMLDVADQNEETARVEEDEGSDGEEDDPEDGGEHIGEKQVTEGSAPRSITDDVANANNVVKEEDGKDSNTRPPVGERKVSNEVDEETDLWGHFGFGLQDGSEKNLDRRQSVTGFDESGFGLITEDDFDFFDEAANGVANFDDMEVDIGQPNMSDQRGDATYQSLDTDNGSEMALTNSTFLDPPSLPGFTPGSLSGTSENDAKALGGLNAKTPRTPFSPSQDMADAHVSIEGEGDAIFHDSRRYYSDASFVHMDSSMLNTRQDGKDESVIERSQTWSPQNREHLMSKYEEGKFALPRAPTRKRADADEPSDAGTGNAERELHPRNRLRHRAQSTQRLSNDRHALSRKTKAGNLVSRNGDEASDLEATVDGSVSDGSSLVDGESDDDMTSASEDTSEEEGIGLQDRLSLLLSSIEAVGEYDESSSLQEASAVPDEVADFDPLRDVKITNSLKRLAHNPRVRACVCTVQTDDEETFVRSVARELFTPLPKASEGSKLAVLLSPSVKAPNVKAQQTSSIRTLETPKIMIGCQGAIASMEPTALSLWEKLGLSAVSGPKNVAAMALHCGCLPASWQKDLLEWLSTFKDTFSRGGFGQVALADDALLALGDSHDTSISQLLVQTSQNAEQWTDTIDSLLSRMQSYLSKGHFVVIYAVGVQVQAHCIWILDKLEADLREVAKSRWGTVPNLITIRGIEWKTMATSMRAVDGRSSNLQLARSLYDALDTPIQPQYNHKDHLPVIRPQSVGVVHPSFTLAPINHLSRNKARFQLQWKAEPYNMTDAGLLLNVAYHIAQRPGEVTFIAIMDEKAQGYFVDGWQRRGDVKAELERIWLQVQKYAAQARILWRIVMCRQGRMSIEEVEMWSSLLKQPSESLRAIDITLTCLEMQTPLTLILPRPDRSEAIDQSSAGQKRPVREVDEKTTHYIDAKQVDYAVYPPFRIAMCQAEERKSQGIILPLSSSATVSFSDRYNGSISASSGDEDKILSRTAPRHYWVHLLQVYKAPYSEYQDPLTLEDRTEIITKCFHQLAFIGRERFLLEDDLPWHVSMLAIACRARLLF